MRNTKIWESPLKTEMYDKAKYLHESPRIPFVSTFMVLYKLRYNIYAGVVNVISCKQKTT